jgi:molybdopterin synthase catalytic subunit
MPDVLSITKLDFSVDFEIARIRSESDGALVSFVGSVRDDGNEFLEVEIYEEMALKHMKKLAEEARAKFKTGSITIIHRKGKLKVGENIVLIAVAAPHRKEAFDACEWLIDELKKVVPIWKSENVGEGGADVGAGAPAENTRK